MSVQLKIFTLSLLAIIGYASPAFAVDCSTLAESGRPMWVGNPLLDVGAPQNQYPERVVVPIPRVIYKGERRIVIDEGWARKKALNRANFEIAQRVSTWVTGQVEDIRGDKMSEKSRQLIVANLRGVTPLCVGNYDMRNENGRLLDGSTLYMLAGLKKEDFITSTLNSEAVRKALGEVTVEEVKKRARTGGPLAPLPEVPNGTGSDGVDQ